MVSLKSPCLETEAALWSDGNTLDQWLWSGKRHRGGLSLEEMLAARACPVQGWTGGLGASQAGHPQTCSHTQCSHRDLWVPEGGDLPRVQLDSLGLVQAQQRNAHQEQAWHCDYFPDWNLKCEVSKLSLNSQISSLKENSLLTPDFFT